MTSIRFLTTDPAAPRPTPARHRSPVPACPGMVDVGRLGYTLPAWTDLPAGTGAPIGDDVVRLEPPWTVITDPGWSLLVLPPLVGGSPFDVIPGVVNADVLPLTNVLGCWRGDSGLAAGEPLAQLVPFQRVELDASYDTWTHADHATALAAARAVGYRRLTAGRR